VQLHHCTDANGFEPKKRRKNKGLQPKFSDKKILPIRAAGLLKLPPVALGSANQSIKPEVK
jgi:hypothetical protein